MSLSDAQRLTGHQGEATTIAVQLAPGAHASDARRKIEASFPGIRVIVMCATSHWVLTLPGQVPVTAQNYSGHVGVDSPNPARTPEFGIAVLWRVRLGGRAAARTGGGTRGASGKSGIGGVESNGGASPRAYGENA